MSFNVPQPINQPLHAFRRAAGFTFVELMITLILGIILVAIAVPQFTIFIQTQKSVSVMNDLEDDLQFARSEGMKEGQFVSLCPSTNGTGCTAGTWDCGWIVYSNPGFSAAAPAFVAGTSILLRVRQGLSTTSNCAGSSAPIYSIVSTPVPTSSVVTYNRDGFAVNLLASSPSGLLFTLHTSPTVVLGATRCLWMDILGRQYIQIANQTAASGQVGNSCT